MDERNEDFKEAMNDGEIVVKAGILNELADALEAVLTKNNAGVFQRGGILVSISRVPIEVEKIKRKGKAHVIAPVSAVRLRELGSKYSNWTKFDNRKQDYKTIDCPREVADTLWNRTEWDLPLLRAVLGAPTIGENGEIICQPGHDENTGVFLYMEDWKEIENDNPTLDDAIKALAFIEDLVSEFPFVDAAGRAAWVACLLTSLIRWSLRTAPFFSFDAPVMATGKSLLAELIGILCTGREPATTNQPSDPAEAQKKLLASLLAGDPVLLIDNIEHPIYGEALCSVATSDTYRDRMLGRSQMVTVSTAVTIMLNGNNLTVRGDLSTRILVTRLDAGMERPEERVFKRNIRVYAYKHRHDLVNAALTILRAYELAGRPKVKIPEFGRFEEWSARVRAPLVWAGAADPCDTRSRVESADPEREMHAALLTAWWNIFEERSILVKDIIQAVTSGQGEEETALGEAVATFAGDGNRINNRKLGNRIRKWEGRVAEGMKLERLGKDHSAQIWRLVRTEKGSSANSGSSNDRGSKNIQQINREGGLETMESSLTSLSDKVRSLINEACIDFDITTEQFIPNLSKQDIADIESGDMPASDISAWVEHFDKKLKLEGDSHDE